MIGLLLMVSLLAALDDDVMHPGLLDLPLPAGAERGHVMERDLVMTAMPERDAVHRDNIRIDASALPAAMSTHLDWVEAHGWSTGISAPVLLTANRPNVETGCVDSLTIFADQDGNYAHIRYTLYTPTLCDNAQ